ncbi:MAG: carbohydrate ABC transporter permease [Lachnospiraceae bacterium]|nr:carbohydrate ABC transporter permease [Lachnospiraceae bacterium]MDE6973372.1 carbohydrate ABC transporter permease [Lachnospiraceae bacterium]
MNKKKKKFHLSDLILNLAMLLVALTMLIPILNLLAKSISTPASVPYMKGYQIWPSGFDLINYEIIFSNQVVWTALKNSLFITVVGVLVNVLVTTMMAYALTRPGLVGKKAIMVFLIIMMIFEPGIIQEYFVMKDLHLLDNLWSMVLYRSVSVYNVILLMRFFQETPEALLDAAKIDGAGHIRVLFSIFLPLNKIPILTIGMFYAVYRWNEFFHSSIFLSSRGNTVLQVFLRQFVVEGDTTALSALGTLDLSSINMSALRASTIIVTMVPILVLYPFILKYYTSGVMVGAVKE